MKVFFDARELYFVTQYRPVWEAVRARGGTVQLVHYRNRASKAAGLMRGFEALDVPRALFDDREESAAHYRREAPDWIVFGNGYPLLAELASTSRTAMLNHGTGVKRNIFAPSQVSMDVALVASPYYAKRLAALYPGAHIVPVGYPKLDPLFRPEGERGILDLASVGLDPRKRTILYAPGHSPSTFPCMPDDLPARFRDFNLVVKPHMLSHFGTRRREHRRKMELWTSAPNCWVAPIEAFDPTPLMLASDVLISDASGILFEFAALDRPVVWADFAHHHWTRRGVLGWRRWKRLDREMLQFYDVASRAGSVEELPAVIEDALANPGRRSARRREVTALRFGPTDGRTGERIAELLFARTRAPRRGRESLSAARGP